MKNKCWYVKETPCWPAQYKVTFDFQGQDFGSNETSNYFRDREEACREADRRNERFRSDAGLEV